MIEVAAKVIEVSAEIAQEAQEVAKEVGKNVLKEPVDINKRIDVTKPVAEIKDRGIDISKRIVPEGAKADGDIKGKDLSDVVKEYVSDLKARSECADTISEKSLDVSKMEKVSPERVAELREEFDDNKPKLRKEWEIQNNREWPKYKEDVYNDNGIRIRKAGDNYDAHHIQPLSMGGKNEVSNLTPLDLSKHQDIHSLGGSCTQLVEKFGGKV